MELATYCLLLWAKFPHNNGSGIDNYHNKGTIVAGDLGVGVAVPAMNSSMVEKVEGYSEV